jgi:predicted PurR-regulated permease PerM
MEKQNFIRSRSTIETLLIVLFFLGLIYALFDVLKVFLGIFTFSLIFAVSFAKPFEKLVSLFKGRRKLTAVIYAFLLIAILVQPFLFLISALSHHVREIIHLINDVKQNGLPPLSPSVSSIPWAGESISGFYTQLQQQPKETLVHHEEQIRIVLRSIIAKGAGVFGAAAEIILGIIISAFFLSGGDKVISPFSNALKHILGKDDADALLNTTAMAIKGVSIGIIGTALIATIVAWIGLFIAGIHFSLGIAAIVFFLVIIQVGPLPVWIPITIWVFMQGHTGWGIFMIVYGIVLLLIDSVVKPLLISKSGKLPFLVLFLGVIGGLFAWGFTGMFKGAIIVAVCYTIFINWLERKEAIPNVAS